MQQMAKVSWDGQSYSFGDERRFLISGEFHYFRVPQADWRRRLRLWKDAGGNAIATYVPWLIHEPEEGHFVFGPEPWLQVEKFLQVCAEEQMHVLARPGPYQYSELKGAGVPLWVFQKYPQVLATDLAGKPRNSTGASYLHPIFLDKTRAWFDKICPLLAKYTIANGGPIAMTQFDNELMGIHEWFGGWDYNPETMGSGTEDGRYPRFLRERYGTIEAVNAAYGTTFASFAEARPIEGKGHKRNEDRRRVRDYMEFYFATTAEYAQILMQMMRDRGLDLPFVHNSANQGMNSYFLEMMRQTKGQVLLGSDHYYTLGMDWDQNNPTPLYASKCYFSLEMLRLMGCPPTVFEMPGGSCSDFPPITPTDLRACYWMHAAMGLKGVNYYILTGGPNPPGAGTTTDLYDYGAAIAADGTVRPILQVQKEFAEFLHTNPWLATATQETDFNIGLDWEHSRASNYFAERGDLQMSSADAWLFWRKGMFFSAMCSSWSPGMADLYTDDLLSAIDKPLWLATSACMVRAVQERLVRFVEAGGRLLLAPVIPYLDESLQPCAVLRDFLDGAATKPWEGIERRLNVGPVENVAVTGRLFVADGMPAGARAIAHEVNNQATCGWTVSRGKGSVTWLGLQWTHSMSEHGRMVSYLLEQCGVTGRVVECDNPNVWAILRRSGDRRMLFLLNLFSSPMEANVRLSEGAAPISYQLSAMQVQAIEVG